MPRYSQLSIVQHDDQQLDDLAVVKTLEEKFTVGKGLVVCGRPRVVIISVFEIDCDDIHAAYSEQELKDAIVIGDKCFFDSTEGASFPNHPLKLTCVKAPGRPLGEIQLGNNVNLQGTAICSYGSISIGENTVMAPGVVIMDCDGHTLENRNVEGEVSKLDISPVSIGKDVWIGYGAIILPGVTIGDGVVIGAGSVVSRSIPAGCTAVGNPCRPINKIVPV